MEVEKHNLFTLPRSFRRGYRVLVIDTDESNFGLHNQLGLTKPLELMDHLGGKKMMGKKMMESMSTGAKFTLIDEKWTIADIPDECLSRKGDIWLMQIGKVRHFSEGCACPMGSLAREFLEKLTVNDDEIVIVDTEAGIEHMGRGVEKGCDLVLMVVDPSNESIRLSEKIGVIMEEAGKPVHIVLSKIDDRTEPLLRDKIRLPVVASVPFDLKIFSSGLMGDELTCSSSGVMELATFVEEMR